ncbi:MAG: 1-deoxy-D-xylulose-5-phosphate reductoisomerase [Solirubrobacteraceae bacterium]|jgi:1-deoxy-D-xylulose-5-phosphate reductoisomerase|nr:1-deoxy-D-xylulose-5-phosphate reductoisomerase [Solirubrobacteraceae bacterium]MDP4672591.1 1-deoxy-D-xylulose-5-phosphate reductoisomerase [Solirubrobacteraceae bacterium]MDP4921655.1 1-deoxy-D-xylulose-5-phosphate reductoisomerase [Solirubrobacteraceae bacterium]
MRKLVILGSTGSIGTQALELVAAAGDLEVVALSADRHWEELISQADQHGVRRVALADEESAERARASWDGEVLSGPEALAELILGAEPNLVLNAIVGSAGLAATVITLSEGIDLALANKESLVVGGELVIELAAATGARLLPVDSEHSALYQLIASENGQSPGTIESLTLTASGGPFRGRSRAELGSVTVEEALDHPTWQMGGKISIDSATLMNKGLEVIEAHQLFGTAYEDVEVVIHPQSIVHAMISLSDGSSLAHLGYPDMKVPIAYALYWPQRAKLGLPQLNLEQLSSLDFEAVDNDAFPCLGLALAAGRVGGTAPCVLNAANEVAVAAFLDRRCGFLQIAEVIEATLNAAEIEQSYSFATLIDADRGARRAAGAHLAALA